MFRIIFRLDLAIYSKLCVCYVSRHARMLVLVYGCLYVTRLILSLAADQQPSASIHAPLPSVVEQ